jgi:hypothetical protein
MPTAVAPVAGSTSRNGLRPGRDLVDEQQGERRARYLLHPQPRVEVLARRPAHPPERPVGIDPALGEQGEVVGARLLLGRERHRDPADELFAAIGAERLEGALAHLHDQAGRQVHHHGRHGGTPDDLLHAVRHRCLLGSAPPPRQPRPPTCSGTTMFPGGP